MQQEVDPLSLPKDTVDGHLARVAQSTRLKQHEHRAPERGGEEEAGGSVEGDGLVQDNQTRIDATAEMHLKKVRSPDHFRTQYLSNLGIWADNQAKQLTSAPRTEARYKRNVGSGGAGLGLDEIAPEHEPPLLIPPRTPASIAPTGGAGAGASAGPGVAGGAAAALAPLKHQQHWDEGEKQSIPAVLSEGNARRDGGTSERREERSAGRSGYAGTDRLLLLSSLPRPRAATTGQEGMPGAVAVVSRTAAGAAGGGETGGFGGEKTSEEGAGAACQAVVDISAAAAAATGGVEGEGGVVVDMGGTRGVPGTEQGRGEALSSAAVSGVGGDVAAGGSSEVSVSGLEKKGGSVFSPTKAVVARVEEPNAVTAAAEGTAELEAAVAGSPAAAESAEASGAGLSIEPSAAAAEAAVAASTATAVAGAAPAPAPAATDTPEAPGGDSGTTVSSAVCTGPRKPRRHSISSDGRPPVSEAAASLSSARSSGIGTRTMANPVMPGSPPLRAVKPPRRDIRKDYLTNLGMKRAVVAGPGGTRTPPPMIRRSSFIESVEHPVEEQLKDPNAGDITLEDVLRVVGSLLTGGGGKREIEPRQCPTCVKQKTLRGSPPLGGRRDCEDGRNGRSGSGGHRRSKTDVDKEGGAEGGAAAPCGHKHVDFAPLVSAVYIPVHNEYSDRVRRSYWNSAGEIREMVYRNMIEFDAEEYNWEKVAEEEDMYFCEETGEFIHPIFFDSHEEAREVRANSTDGEDHVEYINEGRKMPVMQRR